MIVYLSLDNPILNYVHSYLELELLYLISAVSSYYHFYYKRLTRTAQLPLPHRDYKNRLHFFEWFVSVYFISLCCITFKNRDTPVLNDLFEDIVEQYDSSLVFFQPPLGWASLIIVGVYFCYALLHKIKKRPTPENDNHRPDSGSDSGSSSDSDSDSGIINYYAYIYEFLQRNTEKNGPATASRRNAIAPPTVPERLAILPAPPASTQPRSTSTQTDPSPLQIEPTPIQTRSSSTQTDTPSIQISSTQTESPSPTQTEPPFYEHLTDAYQKEMVTIFNSPPAAATTTTTDNVQQAAESTPASVQLNDDEPSFDSILELLVNAADILNGAIDNLQRNNDAASFDLVSQALIQSTIVLNRAVKLVMNPFSRPRFSSESQTSHRSVQPISTPASQSTIPRISEVASSNNNGAEVATITDTTHAANVNLTTSNADNAVTSTDTTINYTTVEIVTDNTVTTTDTTTNNTAVEVVTDNTATNAEVVATENTPSRPESSQSSHSSSSSSSNSTRSSQSNHSDRSNHSNQSNHSNHSNQSNHSNPPGNPEPMVEDTNTQSNAEENVSNITESTTENDANTEPKKYKGKRAYNSTNNTATSGDNFSNTPKRKTSRKQTNQKTQEEIDDPFLGGTETNTQKRTDYSLSAEPSEPVGVEKYTPEDWESIKLARTKEFNLGNEPTNNSNKWLSDTDFSVGISTGWERSDMSIRTDTPVSGLSASPTDLAVTDQEITKQEFAFTPKIYSAIRPSLSKSRSTTSSNLSTSRPTRATNVTRNRSTTPTKSRIPVPPIPERSHVSGAESEFLISISPDISSIGTSPSVIFGSRNYSTPLIPEPFVPTSSHTTSTSSAPRFRLTARTPNLPQPTTIDWSDPISPKSESPGDEWIMESMYGAQEQAENSSSNLVTQQASSSQQQTHDSSTGAVSKWANFANLLSTTEVNSTGTAEQIDSWTTVGPRQRSSRPSKRGGLKKKKVTFQLETRELSQTRCRRWPYCNQFEECTFSHPQTDCLNGDSCQYKHRCGYLHHPRDDKNYKIWLNRKKYM